MQDFAARLALFVAVARNQNTTLRGVPDYKDAQIMGIAKGDWSLIRRGKVLPQAWECLAIARRFLIPLDAVLRAAGYLDVAGILEAIEHDPLPAEEQPIILDLLRRSLTAQSWKKASWQVSDWKDIAEEALASNRSLHAKARIYAKMVYGFAIDVQRLLPLAEKRTDELPVIAS